MILLLIGLITAKGILLIIADGPHLKSKPITGEKGEFRMARITVKEAARRMQCGEQQVRMLCQLNKIPGAFCTGPKGRRTYYIYDNQIENLQKGVAAE